MKKITSMLGMVGKETENKTSFIVMTQIVVALGQLCTVLVDIFQKDTGAMEKV